MPLNRTSYRFSYLQQTEYSNSNELLGWLQLAKETVEENEQTINQLIIEKEELITQLTEFQEQREDKKKFLQLITELERKEQENEELVQINSFLQSELINLQNQTQQQTQQFRQINQNNQNQDQQLKGLKEVLAEKEEVIINLQQRLTDLNVKEQKSRLSRERLENHLSMNYNEKAQSEIQLQKCQAQIQYLKSKNASLSQVEQELLKVHEKNTLTNRELKSDLETVSEQLRANQQQNLLLEERIRDLEQELIAKSNQEENPNSDNLQQKLQIANLETELDEQKKVYQELTDKYQKLFLSTEKLKKEQITQNEDTPSLPFWKSQKVWWMTSGIILLLLGGWWFARKYFG